MPERDDNPTCRSLPPSMDCLATTDLKKGAGGEPKKKKDLSRDRALAIQPLLKVLK